MSSRCWSLADAFTDQRWNTLRNKSIIAYLSAHGLAETLAAFRKESDFPDNMFDATAAKQYENLLERKWTSNSTLMKKVATPCSIWAELFNAIIPLQRH